MNRPLTSTALLLLVSLLSACSTLAGRSVTRDVEEMKMDGAQVPGLFFARRPRLAAFFGLFLRSGPVGRLHDRDNVRNPARHQESALPRQARSRNWA